jgi:hypothetical protein
MQCFFFIWSLAAPNGNWMSSNGCLGCDFGLPLYVLLMNLSSICGWELEFKLILTSSKPGENQPTDKSVAWLPLAEMRWICSCLLKGAAKPISIKAPHIFFYVICLDFPFLLTSVIPNLCSYIHKSLPQIAFSLALGGRYTSWVRRVPGASKRRSQAQSIEGEQEVGCSSEKEIAKKEIPNQGYRTISEVHKQRQELGLWEITLFQESISIPHVG